MKYFAFLKGKTFHVMIVYLGGSTRHSAHLYHGSIFSAQFLCHGLLILHTCIHSKQCYLQLAFAEVNLILQVHMTLN